MTHFMPETLACKNGESKNYVVTNHREIEKWELPSSIAHDLCKNNSFQTFSENIMT